jgi:hypothetical protein
MSWQPIQPPNIIPSPCHHSHSLSDGPIDPLHQRCTKIQDLPYSAPEITVRSRIVVVISTRDQMMTSARSGSAQRPTAHRVRSRYRLSLVRGDDVCVSSIQDFFRAVTDDRDQEVSKLNTTGTSPPEHGTRDNQNGLASDVASATRQGSATAKT